MIIVNPNPNTIVQNRMTRDGVDKSFAEQETKKELEKLKAAFPSYVKISGKPLIKH